MGLLASPVIISLLFSLGIFCLYFGLARRGRTNASRQAFNERLEKFREQAGARDAVGAGLAASADAGAQPGLVSRLGRSFSSVALSGVSGLQVLELIDRRLEAAGRPKGMTATDWVGWYVLRAGSVIVLGGMLARAKPSAAMFILYAAAVLLACAFPVARLSGAAKERQEQAFSELPAFVDELILGLSSGEPLNNVMRKTVLSDATVHLGLRRNVLITEFRRAWLEQSQHTRPMEDAYRDAAARIGVQEVDDLVELLIEGYLSGSETTIRSLEEMSTHIYTLYEQNMTTLIKKKETSFMMATVIIMFATAILIVTPIALTVLKALSGGAA